MPVFKNLLDFQRKKPFKMLMTQRKSLFMRQNASIGVYFDLWKKAGLFVAMQFINE